MHALGDELRSFDSLRDRPSGAWPTAAWRPLRPQHPPSVRRDLLRRLRPVIDRDAAHGQCAAASKCVVGAGSSGEE